MIHRLFNAYVLYPIAERFLGRDIRSKLEVLRRDSARSYHQRKERQREQLAKILRTAGAEVPYYRELFQHIGFDPTKVATEPDCIQEIPYLTKDIIRSEGERLLNERFHKDRLHERKTGGSTGPAVKIYYSREALDWTAAINLMVLEWAGKERSSKEIHLASRFPETFPLKDRIKERVKCATLNRANIFTSSLDQEGLERIWRRLRRNKSYLIQGHPSTMYTLARYISARGYDASGLFQVFESTGESIDKRQRETIESAFDCRVVNRYGNAEFGVVAYQKQEDAHDRLSVVDFAVWPESVESSSDSKELVLTGLTNHAMPLIRYRTGDLAEVLELTQGAYLTDLKGRIHDVVRIGDRVYPTHYIQDLLDRLGGIAEFQVVERIQKPLVLRLVPEATANRDIIESRIRDWWAHDIQVKFVDFQELKKQGRQGKFRHVVQE